MKKLVFIIVAVVLLSIFFFTKPLSYSLTEERINRYLVERAESEKFNRELSVSDIAKASVKLSEMSVEVGRREPNKVQFTAKASLAVDSLLGKKDTTLNFVISATPYYNPENKAVYIKSIEINDAKTESSSVNTMMPVIKPILSEGLESYFENHPVYKLDPERRFKEKIAYKFGTGIEVKPGKIVISFLE